MGKLKTKKGVAKRYKLTKSGKIKYSSGGKSHLATAKTTKMLRKMRRRKTVGRRKERRFLKKMLPYG